MHHYAYEGGQLKAVEELKAIGAKSGSTESKEGSGRGSSGIELI
jgi:hypothetical protein